MQEAEVKEESNSTAASKSGKRQVKPVDPDPNGEKLLQVPGLWLGCNPVVWVFLMHCIYDVVNLAEAVFHLVPANRM